MSVQARHIRCVLCEHEATHVVAYIRTRGLAAKVYAYCDECPDDQYWAMVTPLTRRDGGPILTDNRGTK